MAHLILTPAYTFGIAGIADFLVSRYHFGIAIPNAIPKFISYTFFLFGIAGIAGIAVIIPTQFKYSHY